MPPSGNCRVRSLARVRDQRVSNHPGFPEGARGRAVYQAQEEGPAEAEQVSPPLPTCLLSGRILKSLATIVDLAGVIMECGIIMKHGLGDSVATHLEPHCHFE